MVQQPVHSIPAPLAKPADRNPSGPGRPKDLGKRLAVLEAAKRLFVTHGFSSVSMDQIAADAGVSKLTVYSHFGDKEALFFASVEERCREQLPDDLFAVSPSGPVDQALRSIGPVSAKYQGELQHADLRHTDGYALRLRGITMLVAPGNHDDYDYIDRMTPREDGWLSTARRYCWRPGVCAPRWAVVHSCG